jgi:hypothetical protein
LYTPQTGLNKWYGFGDGDSMQSQGNAFFNPIWDEWVEEVLIYDPVSNITTYSLNGATPVTYETTPNLLTQSYVDIQIASYGWFTGHYIEVDYIKLEQEVEAVPEPQTILGVLTGLCFGTLFKKKGANRTN